MFLSILRIGVVPIGLMSATDTLVGETRRVALKGTDVAGIR